MWPKKHTPLLLQVVKDMDLDACADWMYNAMMTGRTDNEQMRLMRSIIDDGVLEVRACLWAPCLRLTTCMCMCVVDDDLADPARTYSICNAGARLLSTCVSELMHVHARGG